MDQDNRASVTFRAGDQVEVNIAGLGPITVTDVLLDPEAHEDWHPAVVTETFADGTIGVLVTPLIGAIEVPAVDPSRLRRRV